MQPKLILLRDTNIDLHKDLYDSGFDVHLTLDVKSTLFIPKNHHKCMDPIDDGLFTMHHVPEVEFLRIPVQQQSGNTQKGIVIPYDLIDETDDEFMFKCYVIDPMTKHT